MCIIHLLRNIVIAKVWPCRVAMAPPSVPRPPTRKKKRVRRRAWRGLTAAAASRVRRGWSAQVGECGRSASLGRTLREAGRATCVCRVFPGLSPIPLLPPSVRTAQQVREKIGGAGVGAWCDVLFSVYGRDGCSRRVCFFLGAYSTQFSLL